MLQLANPDITGHRHPHVRRKKPAEIKGGVAGLIGQVRQADFLPDMRFDIAEHPFPCAAVHASSPHKYSIAGSASGFLTVDIGF